MVPSDRDITSLIQKPISWQWDFRDGTFEVGATFFELFALSEKEIPPSQQNIITLMRLLLPLAEWEDLKEGLLRLRNQKQSFKASWKIPIGDQIHALNFQALPIVEENKVIQAKGTLRIVNNHLSLTRLQLLTTSILEKIDRLTLIFTLDYTILYVNQAACEHLGYTMAELKALPLSKIDIENSKSQWNSFLHLLEEEETIETETSFQRKDGTILPVRATLIHFEDDNGELICLFAQDISALRREESEWRPSIFHAESLRIQLEEERSYFQETFSGKNSIEHIISQSENYEKVLRQVKQVAPTNSTVLIEGETGTGKELLARAVHQLSRRKKQNLIVVNCASLPKELIESELFGHEKGAFTGAEKQKRGRFELADGGTLFLDEIGELPLSMQPNLLRVLQEGAFHRVGGTQTISVDVRIIAATNRSLQDMVDKGTFREDLFYRLHVFPIYNTPLRERKEDIPLLANFFIQKYAKKINRTVNTIRKEDLRRLAAYDFPGNIRELENIIERGIILSTGTTLNLDFWSPQNKSKAKTADFPTLVELQKSHIVAALEKCKWKVSGKSGAAELLGMKEQTLFSRMRKYGISRI